MTIWIIALVLLLSFAGTGYMSGAIRSSVSLIGLFLAAVLAIPLSPMVSFVFPLFGYNHPLFPVVLGPVLIFLLIEIIFRGIGAFVHRKAEHYYKYGANEAMLVLWERMNRRVGLGIGVIHATIYVVMICLFVSVVGYLLIQTGGDKNPSFIYRFLASAAEDLKSTKMDKVVAAYNPAPEKYFEISDLIGLLYHNRLLQNRMETYPPFAAMADRPLFKAIGGDNALQEKLQSEVNLLELLDHPKIQEITTNSELSGELLSTDLKDLKEYLETGRSPKFEAEKILGHWVFNAGETLKLAKAAKSDLPYSLWVRTKLELAERYEGAVFTAFSDKRAFLKLPKDGYVPPPPPPRTNTPPRWVSMTPSFSGKGNWKGSPGSYEVTLKDKNSRSDTSPAVMQGERMSFQYEDRPLVFDKLP